MKSSLLGLATVSLATISLAAIVLMGSLSAALADDARIGSLHIDHAWARATPALAKTGAAYLTISNDGEEMDRLIAVATPAARKASLHTILMEDDIMKMRPVRAIEVHPGTPSVLKPGGLHVMLMGLRAPLEEGTTFRLTLTFETAGSVEVEVVVEKIGAMGPADSGHGAHDQMMN